MSNGCGGNAIALPLKLVVLTGFVSPRDLLTRWTLVCRAWNAEWKRDRYWVRYKTHLLERLPCLASVFSGGCNVWKCFARRLWPMFRSGGGKLREACAAFHALPLQIQTAIVMAAHYQRPQHVQGMEFDTITVPAPRRQRRDGETITYSTVKVRYTNGRMVQMTLFAQEESSSTLDDHAVVAIRKATGTVRKRARHHHQMGLEYKCITIVRQACLAADGNEYVQGQHRVYNVKALFMPYMDAIFCKGRKQYGRNNNVFLE